MKRPALPNVKPTVFAGAVVLIAVILLLGVAALDHSGNAKDSRDEHHAAFGMHPREDQKPGDRGKGHGMGLGHGKIGKIPKAGPDRGVPFGPMGGFLGGPPMGPIPKALLDDLKQLRQAAPAKQEALEKKMFAKALAGDYGTAIKQKAEKLRAVVTGK
jgi:hypothetical protein